MFAMIGVVGKGYIDQGYYMLQLEHTSTMYMSFFMHAVCRFLGCMNVVHEVAESSMNLAVIKVKVLFV